MDQARDLYKAIDCLCFLPSAVTSFFTVRVSEDGHNLLVLLT